MTAPYPGEVRPWERYGGGSQQRVTPLTPPRAREPSPQTQAQAQKDQLDVQNASLTPQNMRFQQAAKLRDDYNQDPAVKAYTVSVPLYASALQTDASPGGDLQLIYSFAKLMDPNTGVREGEFGTVAGSDTFVSRTVANLRNQLGRTGTFSPEMRNDLRNQMRLRMVGLNDSISQARERYRQTATSFGLSPDDVIGPYPGAPFEKNDRDYWSSPESAPADAPGPDNVDTSNRNWDPGRVTGQNAQVGLQKGEWEVFSTPKDNEYANELRAGIAQKQSFDQLQGIAQKYGYPPLDASFRTQLSNHYRNKTGLAIATPQSGRRQRGWLEQKASDFYTSGPGAAVVGVANGAPLIGGWLDEASGAIDSAVSGKPLDQAMAEADLKKQLIREEHPYAFTVGEMVGQATTPGGAAGRVIGGALYGAGENNDNRLAGGTMGGALALGGEGVGRFMGHIADPSALSPGMRTMVDEGVEVPVSKILADQGVPGGQRLAQMGDAMASSQLVGGPAARVRVRARDSLNRAQINRSLRPIGEELPEEIGIGHQGIDYTHDRLSKGYDEAFSQVGGELDDALVKRFGRIREEAAIPEGTDGAPKLKEIEGELARAFDGKLEPGAPYNGRTMRTAADRLGSMARDWSSSDNIYVRDAAFAASEARNELLNLVSRQNPAVADRLKSLNQAWSHLIRTEKAALTSPDGVFSAAQLNSAVRQTNESLRRSAVSRGAAFGQDLSAPAAKILKDVSPRTGATDINAPLAAAGAGGSALTGNPYGLALTGAFGANMLVNNKAVQGLGRKLLTREAGPYGKAAAPVLRAIGRTGPIWQRDVMNALGDDPNNPGVIAPPARRPQ